MNLSKYYQTQRLLDFEIERKFELKPLENMFNKFLALIVEMGETANEHRGFKFWSGDREPRTWYPNQKDICESCNGEAVFVKNGKLVGQCEDCDGCGVNFHNPLLEEFVDSLKFALSIGSELDIAIEEVQPRRGKDLTKSTLQTIYRICQLAEAYDHELNKHILKRRYQVVMECLLGLAVQYGLTEEEIDKGFYEKNQVNYERLEAGV